MESDDAESTRLIKHMEVLTILLGACIYIWMEEDMEVLAIILSTYQNSLHHCCVLHVPKMQLLMSRIRALIFSVCILICYACYSYLCRHIFRPISYLCMVL